jgi:sporulation protein YabP
MYQSKVKGVHGMVEQTTRNQQENVSQESEKHQITLIDRKTLRITGVTSVESFDSEEFLLDTDCGFLGIRGRELHIKSLDLEQGNIFIEGYFLDISYLDANPPKIEKSKSLLGRLLR